jgi:tetratricopeptide (TPR) repeat protein
MQGNFSNAIEEANKALTIQKDNIEANIIMAQSYFILGKNKDSIIHAETVLLVDNNNTEALKILAYNYSKLGQYDKSIQYLNKVINIINNDIVVLNYLSIEYAKANKINDALLIANKAIDYDPENDRANYNLARIHSIMGNHKEAIKWLKKSITLNTEFKIMSQTQKDFDNIRYNSDFIDLTK